MWVNKKRLVRRVGKKKRIWHPKIKCLPCETNERRHDVCSDLLTISQPFLPKCHVDSSHCLRVMPHCIKAFYLIPTPRAHREFDRCRLTIPDGINICLVTGPDRVMFNLRNNNSGWIIDAMNFPLPRAFPVHFHLLNGKNGGWEGQRVPWQNIRSQNPRDKMPSQNPRYINPHIRNPRLSKSP